MEDTAQCLILNHQLGNSPEQELTDKLKEIINEKNTQGFSPSAALNSQGYSNIQSICVGPQNIGVLLKDGGICRWATQSRIHHVQPPSSAPSQGNNSGGPNQAANRGNLPKFRRVMLSASSFDRFRRDGAHRLVLDRGRPMLPASSVPEDLISQAQVVLQGKSREVIVRELQRTNLNVNEAVNNLLSRDDDEDDEGEGGEVVLPEELLSLLDPSSGSHPILDTELYGADFEYVLGRDLARRRAEKEKDKKSKDNSGSATPTAKSRWELDDQTEWWSTDGKGTPDNVERFVMMTATGSELLAVTDTGILYGWSWDQEIGDLVPHKVAQNLIPANDPIVQISSSRLRVVCLLKSGQICSWLDNYLLGDRVCSATEVKPVSLGLNPEESVVQLIVSDHLGLAQTSQNAFHWIGMYPFSERPKLWEKEKNKSKKHVTFDTNSNDIKEGAEVRTKACPIYAPGSVAVNFQSHEPMIGILMESVWTLTEVVRFKLIRPSAFDKDFPTDASEGPSKPIGESRKRRASTEIFENSACKEEVWGVCDVIWIHEQQTQDVATVKIVDGAYVGVEYERGKADMTYASSLSGSITSKDIGTAQGKMRLMRKDELVLVTPKMKGTRSPRVFQKEPLRFSFSGTSNRKVISAVAESTGIRALTEKRGRLYITRTSIDGKILSEHVLPVFPQSLYGQNGEAPSLENYGEDSILLLKDGNGAVHPLVRDSMMGFREPQALNLPQVRHFGFCIELLAPQGSNKSPTRKMTLAAVTGPRQDAALHEMPSLSQLVLFCDSNKLKYWLDVYSHCKDPTVIKQEILGERSDYGCNLLHMAIRLSIAHKNKDDADPGTTHGIRLREDEMKMARDEARDLDQRWQRLIRANRSGEPPREEPSVIQAAPIQDNAVQSPESPKDKSQDMPMLETRNEGTVSDPKERQKKAIEIVSLILNHPTVAPFVFQLLIHRDYGGLTPFQAALNIRAYGAATAIWEVIKELCYPPPGSGKEVFPLQKLIYPSGSRPDDNPLFLLCYNDTCSFTWTGDEHINQDIFECRTCGLTGSLCCCTECAYTCHRNHDCKLKRTSPTAYCDCWEKCPCKALIAGNQDKREALLKDLVTRTNLYFMVNNKGEHLMLFLAKTLGRQMSEQSHTNRRRRHHQPGISHSDPAAIPEHDLEPPKFAKFAMETCLEEWMVMKSLIEVGCRNVERLTSSPEDFLCLNSQNGSTHLDKFVFILVSKCGDTILTQVLDCMVKNSKVTGPEEDPNFHQNINRFVRSVLRIYILLMLMSPNAAAVGIKGKNPNASPSAQENRRMTAISVSGLFSIVRPSDQNSKEHKALLLTNIILRCREILLRLCPYAVEQAASLANSLLAPVRYGILRPSCNLQNLVHNNDPVEALEKFLNNEYDLTTLLLRMDDTKERSQRKRKSSKREVEPMEEEEPPRREDSEYSDDSDMDEVPSSRRHNSQSQATEPPPATGENRRKNAISVVFDEELTDPGSSSSDSEPSEDEPEGHVLVDDEIEDEDTEEDDHDERYGENSEGDQDHEENPPYDDPENDEQRNENDYASPSYDSRDVPPGDRELEMDDDERRDGPVPDGQPEDEENTRDAVHSEASSTDAPTDEIRNEMANDSVPRPQPVSATVTIPTEMQRDPPRDPRRDGPRRIPQRYPMSWTTRRAGFLESENDTDERRDSHRDSGRETSTRAPPSSQNNTGTAASPAEQSKKSNTDNVPSIQQTSQQLSLAFAFAIRACCDLLAAFHASQEAEKDDTLNWNDEIYQAIVNRIVAIMQTTWDWMFVVLDRMEAQLRFGNAIMLSDAADVKAKPQKKKDKKDKGEEAPPTNTRKEAMEYLMATMRGQESEAGDDYPLVDVDTLRSLVFIFDGYLNYQEALSRTYYPSRPRVAESAKRKQTMNKFFQRSNSLCFPGSALTEAWDTMSRTMGKIPLAEKQHLLTPEAEQTTLFAPSPSSMTWREYTDLSRMNGISHVMNMNLATLESGVKAYGSNMFLPSQSFEEAMMETDQSPSNGMEVDGPPEGMEKFTVEEVRAELRQINNTAINMAMARWKNVVQFISKECHNELVQSYGGELGSEHLLSAVAKFPVRQSMFRRLMDKFRGQQTKDIAFEVHRESLQLIRDAVFQLNQTYVRRLNTPKGRDESPAYTTPLGSARVKVRFHDEPGEGTGVARSFYTALAEAFQTTKKFPFENLGWEGTEDYLFGNQTISFSTPSQSAGRDRGTLSRIQVIRDRSSASAILSRKRPTKRSPLSADSEPYVPEDIAGAEQRFAMGSYKSERVSEQITRQRPPIAEAIYVKVRQTRPAAAARIAGMLVDIPVSITMHCLSSPDLFKQYVEDAIQALLKVGKPTDLALLSEQQTKPVDSTPHSSDDAPLFARTHKRGLFAPVTGKMSPMRINAFKNVGRIMGLCLSQGELFPLKLARHVLKFILNRPLRWLDLQFYDPVLWESLRQLLTPEAKDGFFQQMDMTFTTDITVEETDGALRIVTIPLKEGGENIPVTKDNVVEYVYKVVELKLLGPDNIQCYSAMRQGITDVLPIESLDGLSAEDLRLLLCGTDNICISSLQAVTTFSDESHAAAETLDKFKSWFWSVVEGLSSLEKQELIFFWTGAPSLPTSPEALQPQPTVMVRPPDDIFLPTANTCISRLYVPLYSSKKLLRAKLQLAIKAKNFGFV